MRDGTSSTALFSEHLVGTGPKSPVSANHPLAKHGYAFKLGLNSPVDVNTVQGRNRRPGVRCRLPEHPRNADVVRRPVTGQRNLLDRHKPGVLPDLVGIQPLQRAERLQLPGVE